MIASNQVSAFKYLTPPFANLLFRNISAAYIVQPNDNGAIINCTSGTFTVALTAAATLGAGFNCWVWNTGTGVITIDSNGTETVDGVDPTTEFKLTQGTGVRLVCTGTAWLTGESRTSGAASIGVLGTQIGRNSAGDMAVAITGKGAIALGGSRASGTDTFAAAIANTSATYSASGTGSVAIGYQNRSTGTYSVCFGGSNAATSNRASIAGGQNNTASSDYAFVGAGYSNTASGQYSCVLGGDNNSATQTGSYAFGSYALSAIINKFTYASGRFSAQGDAQLGVYILRQATTSASATILTVDESAPGSNDQVILPNNSAYAFTGTVVARRKASDGTDSAAWTIEGLIRREGAANTTTLVASTVTAISNVPAWTLALSADTTNGGLKVEVTGATSTNIRWVATVQTTELTYA